MHALLLAALILFAAAAVYSVVEKAWVWAALLAGLACWVAPAAFQLAAS